MFKSRLHSFEFNKENQPSVFLTSQNGLYTYSDLNRFTLYLEDTVQAKTENEMPLLAFMAHSSDLLIFCIAACWKLNIPFVPLNPKITDGELKSYLKEINPDILFTDRKNRYRLGEELPVVAMDDNFFLNAFTHDIRNAEMPDESVYDPESIFGYFFTSGTTSAPKIVPLRRRQMLAAAEASSRNFKPDPNHYWLLCMPLNHIGGISIILRSLIYGSSIYRMSNFNEVMVKEFLGENIRFQAASLVPTMLKRLLDDPLFKTHRDFKSILLGGGPISKSLLKKSAERGIPIVSSYGMTETCAQIIANPLLAPSGMYTPLKSVGRPFPPNKMEIRSESGEKLGKNQSGILWLKGPQVFDGYFNQENNEHKFDENGWFNTGDYGHINGFGHLFIESRRTDLIVTGGENVNPIEVEEALLNITSIDEAIVIGIPDEEWGQKVTAIVTLKNGDSPDIDLVRNALRGLLTDYKIPKELKVVDQLPRTSTGKIKRWQLVEKFK